MSIMLFLPVFSGILFSFIGIAYRIGQAHGIKSFQIMLFAAPACALLFGLQSSAEIWREMPRVVWIWAMVGGGGQVICVLLINRALRMGPLSPLWCASNLTFLLAVLYSSLFLDEHLTRLYCIGLAAGIGTVFMGAWSNAGTSNSTQPSAGSLAWHRRLEYALLLILILISNSLLSISVKALKNHPAPEGMDALTRYQGAFYSVMYLALCAGMIWENAKQRTWLISWKQIGLAAMAGFGSLGGMYIFYVCAQVPAAILFTQSSIASIMGGALVSVFFFREKVSVQWLLMIVLAIVTIILFALEPSTPDASTSRIISSYGLA